MLYEGKPATAYIAATYSAYINTYSTAPKYMEVNRELFEAYKSELETLQHFIGSDPALYSLYTRQEELRYKACIIMIETPIETWRAKAYC